MRLLILLLALLSCGVIVPSAKAVCSNTSLGNGWTCVASTLTPGFSGVTTVGYSEAANQFIIYHCMINSSTNTLTLSDNNNTLISIDSLTNATAGTKTQVSYFYNVSSTANPTATCSSSGGGDTVVLVVYQFTGSAVSGFIDQHAITSGAANVTPSPNVTTTNANDLIFVYATDNTNPGYTASVGFTGLSLTSYTPGEAKSVTATGTYTGTFGGGPTTENWTIGTIAIKGSNGGSKIIGPAGMVGPVAIQ